MTEIAGCAIGLLAKPHDGAERLVIGQAVPRIERQDVVRIGAPLRAVGLLARQRYPRDRLRRGHILGPLEVACWMRWRAEGGERSARSDDAEACFARKYVSVDYNP